MERIFFAQFMLVGFGGFLGSGLRFAISNWLLRLFPLSPLPLGTLCVNLFGCLLIGYLGGIIEQRQAFDTSMRLFLITGILGGFTTFSAFAYESLALAQHAHYFRMLLNVILQVVVGFSAAWLGLMAARVL
jgi:CrcB protein